MSDLCGLLEIAVPADIAWRSWVAASASNLRCPSTSESMVEQT